MFRVNSIEPVPIEAQDIDRIGQATLERVKQLQFDALKRFGYWNPRYGRTQTESVNYDKISPKDPTGNGIDAPKLKMKDLMSESLERRIRKTAE